MKEVEPYLGDVFYEEPMKVYIKPRRRRKRREIFADWWGAYGWPLLGIAIIMFILIVMLTFALEGTFYYAGRHVWPN